MPSFWPSYRSHGHWFRWRWQCGALVLLTILNAQGVVLWNDPDQVTIHENGAGSDILHGALKRDDTANDTLYFKFQVEPISDTNTEEYLAAFELFEGSVERVGIGN